MALTFTLYCGETREQLRALPSQSVQTVITSPPYWALRDYGMAGQIGLEPTPEAYVQSLVEVFREVWRVLRDDGTLWLNLGDSYAREGGRADHRRHWDGREDDLTGQFRHAILAADYGMKPKDLVGIPWRVAFALQAEGWYLRSDIIWHKPNPMPESVADRPTKSHEYLFLLTKNERYYYDADAIRSPHAETTLDRNKYVWSSYAGRRVPDDPREPRVVEAQELISNPLGANKRSVWTIATQSYPEAHFATFPEALVEPCVLAGTSEHGGCSRCGAPWTRVVERSPGMERDRSEDEGLPEDMNGHGIRQLSGKAHAEYKAAHPDVFKGWERTCACEAEAVPQIVLDPFAGSGTTGAVAVRLNRAFIGVELNPEYVALARARLHAVAPMFVSEVLQSGDPAPQVEPLVEQVVDDPASYPAITGRVVGDVDPLASSGNLRVKAVQLSIEFS